MAYWHDMNGWDYLWMIGMMILWVLIVVGGIWAAVTAIRREGGPASAPSAREELDRRLAKGEITEDEYTRRREMIGAPR